MTPLKRQRFYITIFIGLLIIAGSIAAILFARGYRPRLTGGLIQGTGLLSATSYPKSAQVYIDGKLTSATDATINLLPGEYTVRITKEGFLPWEKRLPIKSELVTATDARLFPAAPSLSAITYSGAQLLQPSPDGRRVAYLVTDAPTSDKNGLYVHDLASSPLTLNRAPSQASTLHPNYPPEQTHLLWSPDSRQLLVVFTNTQGQPQDSYLLNPDNLTNLLSATDVTVRLPLIFSQWEEELTRAEEAQIRTLPDFFVNLASSSAIANIYFSPDKEKILYSATADITLPDQLKEPVDSINSTHQTRQLQTNQIYVYDLKEDTNFALGELTAQLPLKEYLTAISPTPTTKQTTPSPAQNLYNRLQVEKTVIETIALFKAHYSPLYSGLPLWYQTSRHLITTSDNRLTIVEYDNTNPSTVYSGSFTPDFFAVSPSGDRLLLLTNLNQVDTPANLYSLDLK